MLLVVLVVFGLWSASGDVSFNNYGGSAAGCGCDNGDKGDENQPIPAGECATYEPHPTGQRCVSRSATRENEHWNYANRGSDWLGLGFAYRRCGGGSQSPIDLTVATSTPMPAGIQVPLVLQVLGTVRQPKIFNNGHTVEVQINVETEIVYELASNYGKLPDDGLRYVSGCRQKLGQFHFHSPSEHKWEGAYADAEVHMVMTNEDEGGFTVWSFPIRKSTTGESTSPFLAPFARNFAYVQKDDDKKCIEGTYNFSPPLTHTRSFYNYAGSLTTPPCTENVDWVVFTSSFVLSENDFNSLKSALTFDENNGMENNRPVQPLNGRVPLRQA
eukprot:NODE_1055_length_1139_cov_506.679817_g803_i0.p1 GENE.NODE_1055_length_1139_cov_506.679817_g803_i0~~NODE_1055_length_1139_cov_506.679817_g803_i0.p1  ORF type:complete len:346 (-),score=58.80 NODE_1055_length_1139_cov_506.679817_g803_i0:100-1086(-)